MASTFKSDTRLNTILKAPTLSVDDKKQIVAELQKSIGGSDKGDTVKNFLDTLAENNRLSVLEGVCDKFETLMGAARGEVEMTITSAQPLDAKMVKQLENTVSKSQYVGQGKKLKVVPKVRLHRIQTLRQEQEDSRLTRTANRSIQTSVAASLLRLATVPSISPFPPRWPA